jgi:hypothetical protein
LSHFAGSTYRPSLCEMRQVDMLLLAALACIQVFWPPPSDSSETAVRGTLNVLVLVAAACYVGTRNPFWPHDAWKLYVKVGSLLLAALAAVLTHYTLAEALQTRPGADQGSASESAAAIRTGLSYAVFAGCILLVITLAVGFWTSTVSGVRIEERLRRAVAQSKRRAPAAELARLSRLPASGDAFSGRNDAHRLSRALGAGGTANPLLSAGRVAVGGSSRGGDPSRQPASPPPNPPLSQQLRPAPAPSRRTIVRLDGEGEERATAPSPRVLATALPCEVGPQPPNPSPSIHGNQPRSSVKLSQAGDGSRASFRQMASRRRISSVTVAGPSGAGPARNSVASMPRGLESNALEAAGARALLRSPSITRTSLIAPAELASGRHGGNAAPGSSAADPRAPRQLFSPMLLSSVASSGAGMPEHAPPRPISNGLALPRTGVAASGHPLPDDAEFWFDTAPASTPRAVVRGSLPHHLPARRHDTLGWAP